MNAPRAFAAPDSGHLTPEMIDAYHADGFLVLEGFASPKDRDDLQASARDLIEGFDPSEAASVFSTTSRQHQADQYFMESGDKIRFFLESEAFGADGTLQKSMEQCLNKIGHAMHDLDPAFHEFSYRGDIGRIASALGSADPAIIQSMYILKPPRIGGEVDWHQDSTYIYTEPDSCIGFWLALEDATLENGCLHFMAGQHTGTLKERNSRTGPFSTTTEVLDDSPWPEAPPIPFPAARGTMVVFHGRAPHFSGPNRSPNSRHAYTLHVIDQECEYPESNWLQRGASLPLKSLTR